MQCHLIMRDDGRIEFFSIPMTIDKWNTLTPADKDMLTYHQQAHSETKIKIHYFLWVSE